MRGSLVCSVVLHAGLLGWALFTIQTQRELRVPEPEPIAVDLVTQSELTKLRQGARAAKQLEAEAKQNVKAEVAKKEAPKPAPVAAAPPPPAPKEEPKPEPKNDPVAEKLAAVPPPPQAAPPPLPAPPVPAPEEQKQLEDMLKEQERQREEQRKAEEARAEEQKRIEEQQKREEERRQAELKKQREEAARKAAEIKKKREDEKKRKEAEAKKKEFDANKIAALLNKTPDKAPPPSASEPAEQPTKNKGPVLGAPEGRDKQLSASEMAILAQIIRSCVQAKWNVLGGGVGAQQTVVKLRLRFNQDGTLASAPVIMNPQTTTSFLAVSDSAIRAVQACEPYSLPPAKYEIWKDIVLNFDPRDMF